MRYYNKDGDWFLDRREFLRKKRSINLNYDTNRREDRMKIACADKITISDIFLILGIRFDVLDIESAYVSSNYNDQVKNYEQILDYANEVDRDLFLLAFEDDSLVIYDKDIIKLYQNEEDLDLAKMIIEKKIAQMGSDVKLKKYMFRADRQVLNKLDVESVGV